MCTVAWNLHLEFRQSLNLFLQKGFLSIVSYLARRTISPFFCDYIVVTGSWSMVPRLIVWTTTVYILEQEALSSFCLLFWTVLLVVQAEHNAPYTRVTSQTKEQLRSLMANLYTVATIHRLLTTLSTRASKDYKAWISALRIRTCALVWKILQQWVQNPNEVISIIITCQGYCYEF